MTFALGRTVLLDGERGTSGFATLARPATK
jgi:hypothetical protein